MIVSIAALSIIAIVVWLFTVHYRLQQQRIKTADAWSKSKNITPEKKRNAPF